MTDFGKYRISYEPGPHDPHSGVLDFGVHMSISGEADLPQLVSFFESFLHAVGYQFKSLTLEKQEKEETVASDKNDFWGDDGMSLIGNPWEATYKSGLPGAEGYDHIFVKSSFGTDTCIFS